MLKKAVQKDETLLADILEHEKTGRSMGAWWLGQSGFLIQFEGKRLLIDPYLSDSLTKKYAATSKPHVRISELVALPELLPKMDVVTSSHNHTDHLDGQTLRPIFDKNPGAKFIVPEANRRFVAERVGCREGWLLGLSDGETIEFDGLKITGLPAKHNEIERDDSGHPKCMGWVFEWAGRSFYHSGDTLFFDEMIEILRPFQLDLAFLPINGNDPARGVAGNLDGKEAAFLAKKIGAKRVVPCHFDLFEFNTADPAIFENECRRLGQPFRTLGLGERLDF